MSEVVKTDALVVKSFRWRDTSKIVHLFTKEKGYVKIIAKGAFRPKSPFRGILEHVNRVEAVLSIRESRGLQLLREASLSDPYSNIRENLDKTATAFSILELIQNFIHYSEAAQHLFDFTIDEISSLNKNSTVLPLTFLYQFLIYLSEYLGFGWNFRNCGYCKKPIQNFPVFADIQNGAVICPDCSQKTRPSQFHLNRQEWKILVTIQQHAPSELVTFPDREILFFTSQNILTILMAQINFHTEQNLQLKSLKMYIP